MLSNDSDRLMPVQEAAQYLGYAVNTLYDKVQADEIPHIRLGRSIRFRKSELDDWIEEQRRLAKAG